jgi:hypothetical protein
MTFENAIEFDGSQESFQKIATALSNRTITLETYEDRPRLVMHGAGRYPTVYVYPGEFVSTQAVAE